MTQGRPSKGGCLRITSASVAVVLALNPIAAAAETASRPWMFKDSRGELALARARGESSVLLVIAAASGRAENVARIIQQNGGAVQVRNDRVDYLRARVPLDLVRDLIGDPDVASIELSIPGGLRTYDLVSDAAPTEPQIRPAPNAQEPRTCPPADLPLTRPYSPLQAMGAEEFRSDNPTFDGRGVTIALIDGTPDILAPELQTATALDGQPLNKIADVLTVVDPAEDQSRDAAGWVTTERAPPNADGWLLYQDASYRTPRPGDFRIGMLDETAFTGGDINRDGNPDGSNRLFPLLWDVTSNQVWLDTDQDDRFDDEHVMSDFGAGGEVGLLGQDNPATLVRESLPFTVQTDLRHGRVALNVGYYPHPTKVIGAAIGSRGDAGRFEGIAPGAQLISIRQGATAHGHVEALIRAAEDPRVDVIVLEGHSTVSDSYNVRDGRLVLTLILERLMAAYDKPILSPASNMPALSAIDEVTQAEGVLAIGASQSQENYWINRGLRAPYSDNLHGASGFGPGGDGGLKPDLLAPSDLLSSTVGDEVTRAFGPGDCYQLPPGYALSNGTSTAAPAAAAGIALLISAARQNDIQHDAASLRHAVTHGARRVPNIAAYQQGAGMMDVAGAWAVLQNLNANGPPLEILTEAPVDTTFSHLLPTPGVGAGLFETRGWEVGDVGERMIRLTRTSGSPEPLTYIATVEGGDGVFGAPGSVTLPLNSAVDVPIRVASSNPGVHSALLTLSRPGDPVPVHRTLLTIVVPSVLSVGAEPLEETLSFDRIEQPSRYFRAPADAGSLEFEIEVPDGDVVINIRTPDGRYRGWAGLVRSGSQRFSIPEPQSGLWEVLLRQATLPGQAPSAAELATPVQATLRVTASGREVIEPASSRRVRGELASGEQHVYEVDVPPGAAVLTAGLGFDDDGAASDLDLYAFDCSGEECRPALADARVGGPESLRIQSPSPGRWKIIVDGFRIDGDVAAYDYFDAVVVEPE